MNRLIESTHLKQCTCHTNKLRPCGKVFARESLIKSSMERVVTRRPQMRGAVPRRISSHIRKARNDADAALSSQPAWDGSWRATCVVARRLCMARYTALLAPSLSPAKTRRAHVGLNQRFPRTISPTLCRPSTLVRPVSVDGGAERSQSTNCSARRQTGTDRNRAGYLASEPH